MTTRDEMRKGILGAKLKKETVDFRGFKVEVHQPEIGGVFEITEGNEMMLDILIKHCFVPDTGEALFEEADRDVLRGQPFDAECREILNAFNRLAGITQEDVDKAQGN